MPCFAQKPRRPRSSESQIPAREWQLRPSTVVVGSCPPSIEDVVCGESTEKPFDLESLMAFANVHFFAETLVFLTEVDKLRHEEDIEKFGSDLLQIVAEFVREGSPSQINLSDRVRTQTEREVDAVLRIISHDPSIEPNRHVLDTAYNSIVVLLRHDQYARYTDHIIVQRQLRVSALDALWWRQKGLTWKGFFSFPCPVDCAESRLHACLTAFLVVIAVCLSRLWGFPWLWAYVTYGFTARVLCGPRLDPQAFFVLFVLRPLVVGRLGLLKDGFTAGSKKRFAQGVGLVFAATCTVLAFLELYMAMTVVASCLFVASVLSGFFNFCLACEMYLAAVHAKMIPTAVCEDCRLRYIVGKEKSVPTRPGPTPAPSGRISIQPKSKDDSMDSTSHGEDSKCADSGMALRVDNIDIFYTPQTFSVRDSCV